MNVIVIDDMPSAIEGLKDKLAAFPSVKVVGSAGCGKDGLELLSAGNADVLFLDVMLPDMSGLDFLANMRAMGTGPRIVVIYTAYDTYILPALRNKAFDVLLKPIDDRDLQTIMMRIGSELADTSADELGGRMADGGVETVEGSKTANILKKKDGKLLLYTNAVDFRLIMIQDICGFQYNHDLRVWEVIAANCETPIRLKRCANKDILMALDENFVQVNQKFIINIKYLMEVKDNLCRFFPPFTHVDYIKVGRMYRRKLIKKFDTI